MPGIKQEGVRSVTYASPRILNRVITEIEDPEDIDVDEHIIIQGPAGYGSNGVITLCVVKTGLADASVHVWHLIGVGDDVYTWALVDETTISENSLLSLQDLPSGSYVVCSDDLGGGTLTVYEQHSA